MAYEKYIKKGDKVYGPYIYHSKRVDGKVVSEYHGYKKGFNYKKFVLIMIGVLFIAVLIFLLISSNKSVTGRVIMDLDAKYASGEPLSGRLKLSLLGGELIPADSKVIFQNNGNNYEYSLRELVSEQPHKGNFYVQNIDISGSGDGYGIPGQKKIYPKINFILNILSSQPNPENKNQLENNTIENDSVDMVNEAANENVETSIEPNKENLIRENVPEQNAPLTGGAISRFFRISGNVIAEFETEIKGSVSAEKEFRYPLREGQRVEIKPKSVVTESGKQLDDNDVSIKVVGDEVIVTTEYFEIESGYGKDYIVDKTRDIIIDISKLDLILNSGSLKISLLDPNRMSEILSLETTLSEGTINTNKTIETNKTKTGMELNPKNETEIEKKNQEVTFIQEPIELTETEKEILNSKFGNYSVSIRRAIERNGFIIVRYELGDFWIENSYSSDLDNETRKSFMERDKIKWLKDIAFRLSKKDEPEINLENF
ncbi:MAG: hypothetical protein QXX55_01635 [Candidatus Pacearchaeota archaeon]